MTTEFQEEQAERLATMRQDADLRQRQQASTLHQHAQAQADELSQGRFRATGTPNVIGADATPAYPAGPAWCAADQSVEPSLGVDVNEMQPTGEVFEVEQSIQQLGSEAVAPPSGTTLPPDAVEVASLPPTTDDEPPRAA